MDTGPSDQELRTFVASMLSNLDKQLREPEVIDDAVLRHRDMWARLYEAASGLDPRDEAGT